MDHWDAWKTVLSDLACFLLWAAPPLMVLGLCMLTLETRHSAKKGDTNRTLDLWSVSVVFYSVTLFLAYARGRGWV